MSKDITKTLTVNGNPEKVYNALMNAEEHSKLTGAPIEVENKVGGKFNCFGGAIFGTNLELIPNTKIVQDWKIKPWEGDFSTKVTFVLTPVDEGTNIEFKHQGIPEDNYEMIEGGWNMNYWDRFPSYLSS